MNLMKRFFLFVLFILTITTANLSATDTKNQQSSAENFDPRSLLYLDGKVTIMHKHYRENGTSIRNWQTIKCGDKKTWELYADVYQNDERLVRVYPNESSNQYAIPVEIKKSRVIPNVKLAMDTVCKHFPRKESSWKIVKPIKVEKGKNGYTILVDTNNSYWSKKDLLRLMLAYDYDFNTYLAPYDAPYSIIIKDMIVNCKTKKRRDLAEFYLDDKSFVSDHFFNERKEFIPIGNSIDQEAILDLCLIDEFQDYKGLGKAIVRTKENFPSRVPFLPYFINNRPELLDKYPLPEAIQQQANAMLDNAPNLKAKFKRLSFTQNKNKMIIDVDNKGFSRTLEHTPMNVAYQYTSIANFFPQKFWFNTYPIPCIAQTLVTDIQFPFKRDQSFTVVARLQDALTETDGLIYVYNCRIGQSLSANTIHPNLPGHYWQVQCLKNILGTGMPAGSAETGNYAYLEDLGVFIQIGETAKGKYQPWPISEVILEH